MGQILKSESFRSLLSYSAPNITLAAGAVVNVGGQQYPLSSSAVVALSGLTAGSRYQVYAVVSAGVVNLVTSANENSVGPAGFTAWKLVGSFYAAAATSLASFVRIRGVPSSSLYNSGVISVSAITTPPTKGSTTTVDRVSWRQIGEFAEIKWEYKQTAAGTAGSGVYLFNLPSGLTIDTGKITVNTDVADTDTDFAISLIDSNGFVAINGTAAGSLSAKAYNSTQIVVEAVQPFTAVDPINSGFFALGQTNIGFTLTVRIPISGWTATAIEDL